MITTFKPEIKYYILQYIPTGDTFLATTSILSDAMEEACRCGPCLIDKCRNCPWFDGSPEIPFVINEALYLLEEI